MSTKTEPAIGWGLRVGGCRPYLAYNTFSYYKSEVEAACTETYHRPVRVALIPLAEFRRIPKKRKKA